MPMWALVHGLGWAFVASHLVLSAIPVRDALIARIGDRGFMAAYSVVAAALMLPWTVFWWAHLHEGATLWTWPRTGPAEWLLVVMSALGLALTGAGVASPSPSSLMSRGPVRAPRGVVRITRHPVMMGLALVCVAHLLGNGTPADLGFWAPMLATCVLGAAHQDQRLRERKPGYAALMAETSFFPWPRARALDRRFGIGAAGGLALAIGLRWLHPGGPRCSSCSAAPPRSRWCRRPTPPRSATGGRRGPTPWAAPASSRWPG